MNGAGYAVLTSSQLSALGTLMARLFLRHSIHVVTKDGFHAFPR